MSNPWEKHTEEVEKMTPTLFDKNEFSSWNDEWQDMPEFIMKKQEAYAELTFRFACEADLKSFSKLIGINLNKNSKGTWFPPFEGTISSSSLTSKRRYEDES